MTAGAGRAALVTRLRALAVDPESGWEAISRTTIRYSWNDRPTPEHLPASWWPDPRFSSHVFVTLGTKFIVGVSRCPWTERRDSFMSQRKINEILDDPRKFLG